MSPLTKAAIEEELREVATVLLDAQTNLSLAQKHYKKAQTALEHVEHRLRRIINYEDIAIEGD